MKSSSSRGRACAGAAVMAPMATMCGAIGSALVMAQSLGKRAKRACLLDLRYECGAMLYCFLQAVQRFCAEHFFNLTSSAYVVEDSRNQTLHASK